jgi:hypothetical protein
MDALKLLEFGLFFCVIYSVSQYFANYMYCGALKEMYKQESHIEDEEELSHIMSYQIRLAEAKQEALRYVAFCWSVLFGLMIIYVFFDGVLPRS